MFQQYEAELQEVLADAEPRLGVGQHLLELGLVLLEHGCTLTR